MVLIDEFVIVIHQHQKALKLCGEYRALKKMQLKLLGILFCSN